MQPQVPIRVYARHRTKGLVVAAWWVNAFTVAASSGRSPPLYVLREESETCEQHAWRATAGAVRGWESAAPVTRPLISTMSGLHRLNTAQLASRVDRCGDAVTLSEGASFAAKGLAFPPEIKMDKVCNTANWQHLPHVSSTNTLKDG
jgi:hypothetical protein